MPARPGRPMGRHRPSRTLPPAGAQRPWRFRWRLSSVVGGGSREIIVAPLFFYEKCHRSPWIRSSSRQQYYHYACLSQHRRPDPHNNSNNATCCANAHVACDRARWHQKWKDIRHTTMMFCVFVFFPSSGDTHCNFIPARMVELVFLCV